MGEHRYKRLRDVKCPECGNYFSSQGIAGHRRGAHGIMQGNGINTVRRVHDVENLPTQQVEITRSLDELRQQMSALARSVAQRNEQQNPIAQRAAIMAQLGELGQERKELQEHTQRLKAELEPLQKEADELRQASKGWSGISEKGKARLQLLEKQIEPLQKKLSQYAAQIQHCDDEEGYALDELDKLTRKGRSSWNTSNGNGNESRS